VDSADTSGETKPDHQIGTTENAQNFALWVLIRVICVLRG
jgi:hypothetical protein